MPVKTLILVKTTNPAILTHLFTLNLVEGEISPGLFCINNIFIYQTYCDNMRTLSAAISKFSTPKRLVLVPRELYIKDFVICCRLFSESTIAGRLFLTAALQEPIMQVRKMHWVFGAPVIFVTEILSVANDRNVGYFLLIHCDIFAQAIFKV